MSFQKFLLFSFICISLHLVGSAEPERIPLKTNVTNARDCQLDTKYTKDKIEVIIREKINPMLNNQFGPVCGCGGIGWTKLADLDLSDSSQSCPTSNWRLVNTGSVRGCGKTEPERCKSAIFSSNGITYSQVCGQINAIQFGSPDALAPTTSSKPAGLEDGYLDGISLTSGPAGSRKHIWSFVAAVYEMGSNRTATCACTNVNVKWPHSIPSFIGNNYFCDSGNRGVTFPSIYYPNDPLWDGLGCGPTSICCRLNNPPWFCTRLSSTTSDNIEVRICGNEAVASEDTVITKLKLYIK